MKIIPSLLLCTLTNLLFSQKEWFIKINPVSGNYTVVDSLTGVRYLTQKSSTYNQTNKQFYFIGQTANLIDHLYTINVNTGAIVNSPTLNISSQQYLANLEYDQSNNTLYGLLNNNSQSLTQLVKINPVNASYTVVGTYTMNTSLEESTYNQNQHQFIFTSMSVTTNSLTLYTLNALTASIISNPLFPQGQNTFDSFRGLEYSATQNKLYTIYYNDAQSKEYLLELNAVNGSSITIGQIANITGISNLMCYDDFNNKLIFESVDQSNARNIYSINTSNAATITNPVFPIDVINDQEAEMQIDNTNGNVYALLWSSNPVGIKENKSQSINAKIYPNPTDGKLNIQYEDIESKIVNIIITNVLGQKVYSVYNCNNKVNLDLSFLSNGIYYLKLESEQESKVFKFLKE